MTGREAPLRKIAMARRVGALPDTRSSMLYSLGAMTTYGHQSLYLEDRWRLLGTLEALNGWLLFGLSTAFLFWLIQEVSPNHRTRSTGNPASPTGLTSLRPGCLAACQHPVIIPHQGNRRNT